MARPRNCPLAAHLAAGAILYAAPSAFGQCMMYDVTMVAGPDCGGLGSPTVGRGINEAGQVVGQYTVCGIGGSEAFLWEGGPNLNTLQRPPGIGGAGAWDINDAGLIAGAMTVDGVGDRAFLYNGSFIDLGVPPGAIHSFGRGINNHGDVVGKWGTGIKAFLYRDREMIDLMPDLGTSLGEALDVNDLGQVTGWMGSSTMDAHAYIWKDGEVTDLGVIPGGFTAQAYAINLNGWVVGSGRVRIKKWPFFTTRTFLWDGSRLLNLATLPGFDRGGALDVNDSGQVVGRAWGVDGNSSITSAFIWQNGVMTDLMDLVPPDAGIAEMKSATAINNLGQITGQAEAVNGDIVAVLLTPVDPPVGDLDRDCQIGTSDLLMLLASWGPCAIPCPPTCLGDLDGNCAVGAGDLLMLLANWG